MAVLFDGRRFEAICSLQAIAEVPLFLSWQGFWQNIVVCPLSIFDYSCYSQIGRRNRTLKTKYINASTTLLLEL